MSENFVTKEPLTTPENVPGVTNGDLLPSMEAGHEIKSEITSQFEKEMQRLGFHSRTLVGENNPLPHLLRSLTLIDHSTLSAEPTVRLYRGVRPTDGKQLAHQVGYILKKPTYDEYGHLDGVQLESSQTFDAVKTFSQNPSYRNIINAVKTSSMSEGDRQIVDGRIKAMRRRLVMFPYRTLLDELTLQHVASPMGAPTQDLSPFVATSLHPEVGAGTAQGGTLMILDVPVSNVAGLGEGCDGGDEVLLTGTVRPEWITATAELHYTYSEDGPLDTLAPLIQILGQHVTTPPETFRNTELHQKSKQNHHDDLREVNHDLIKEILLASHIDSDALRREYSNQDINTYKDALWAAADYYLKRIQGAGQQLGKSIEDIYQYDDVTFFRKPAHQRPHDSNSSVIFSHPEPRQLNIKEVENLARTYETLARVMQAYIKH